MEETHNVVLNGFSPDARRNSVETTSSTPRDKENAGANSTRSSSQSESVDQSKASSTLASSVTAAPPPASTPVRSRLTDQAQQPSSTPAFFATAKTPSPASTSAASAATATPKPFPAQLGDLKSPPGTSQVLRKHFQSLGFATPPGKHQQLLHQQGLLSSGAVRLTPNHNNTTTSSRNKKSQKVNQPSPSSMVGYERRVGYDGTNYTPSKELLKSTTSSRNQRVLDLQNLSIDQQHQALLEQEDPDDDMQIQQPMMDDETSTVASAATMDDASFDISLPSMNHQQQHPFPGLLSSHSNAPAPHSPLTPRMGCLNPVAMTLLNDGKEDYHYLLEQDTLYPIPKVEEMCSTAAVAAAGAPQQEQQGNAATNTSMSSTSTTSSSSPCLSPPHSFGIVVGGGAGGVQQSPAEVRGTLSRTDRSTLARPVAMMPKTGRISPTLGSSHPPRLVMRPQSQHHVR